MIQTGLRIVHIAQQKESEEKTMTIKERRNNSLYINSLILNGNNKLKDFNDTENNINYRYAQFNTRPIVDCPFASEGCKAVCYACKGNHMFPSVKQSRERSYIDSKRNDFQEAMIYTIDTEMETKRYKGNRMILRLHESGDFYSVQYLRKWLHIWEHMEKRGDVQTTMYTKGFRFFLVLTDSEKAIVNRLLENGTIAINFSLDDTTTEEQWQAYHECKKAFPLANTYFCTEHVNNVKHDNVCDCADCAKCGTCNKGTGKKTVVKIHSASGADMKKYRNNINGKGQ